MDKRSFPFVIPPLAIALASSVGARTLPSPKPSPILAKRCYVQTLNHGLSERLYIGDRLCVKFGPSKVMIGVWVNDFEGSDFYPDVRSLRETRPRSVHPWLTLDAQSKVPTKWKPQIGHAYLISFIGRAALEKRPTADTEANGYGHMGEWVDLVLVDYLQSAIDLSVIPRETGTGHVK